MTADVIKYGYTSWQGHYCHMQKTSTIIIPHLKNYNPNLMISIMQHPR